MATQAEQQFDRYDAALTNALAALRPARIAANRRIDALTSMREQLSATWAQVADLATDEMAAEFKACDQDLALGMGDMNLLLADIGEMSKAVNEIAAGVRNYSINSAGQLEVPGLELKSPLWQAANGYQPVELLTVIVIAVVTGVVVAFLGSIGNTTVDRYLERKNETDKYLQEKWQEKWFDLAKIQAAGGDFAGAANLLSRGQALAQKPAGQSASVMPWLAAAGLGGFVLWQMGKSTARRARA